MDCLIKDKKSKKIIIWTLDGSPKFYQVEFNELEIDSNIKLKISWNRSSNTENIITIKLSHSNVIFLEKTFGLNQFLLEYKLILENLFNDMKLKVSMQGMTIYKDYNSNKSDRYIRKIIKYINKKKLKNNSKKSKNKKLIVKS